MTNKEKIVETLSNLTLMEAAELVKVLKETWGVSDMPMMAAMPAAGGASQAEAPKEKTHVDIVLVKVGEQKTGVIKLVRELTGLGLKESKDLVEEAPKLVQGEVEKAKADEVLKQFEALGAQVELR